MGINLINARYILLVNDIYNLKSVKFEMLWIKIITGEIGL